MIEMKGRVRAKQKPVIIMCGNIHIAGVRDYHCVNTDYLPIWYESVGNYIWVKTDSGRRNVKTSFKEKDRFTCHISIGNGGMKCVTYVIFKGEDSIFCVNYLYVILYYLMNHIYFSPLLFFQAASSKPDKNSVM